MQGLLLLSAPTANAACKVCGGDGQNARTCLQRNSAVQPIQQQQQQHRRQHVCSICGEPGHNTRTHAQHAAAATAAAERTARGEYVCGYCQQPGHNIRTCPTHIAEETTAREIHAQHAAAATVAAAAATAAAAAAAAELTAREQVCGYCQQPGHNIRTCPTHIADEGAARARERRRDEQQEEGGGDEVEEEQAEERGDGEQREEQAPINLRTARLRGALTDITLPALFAESPACECASCHRTFLCSARSGSSPREVRVGEGCLVCVK